MNKEEQIIHTQICTYLNLQYPNVIYTSDLSGIRLPIGLAVKAKKQRCKKYKIPDLLILKPMGVYHGLIIEIKKDRDEIYTKKNILKTNQHITEQNKTITELSRLGYFATFGPGFEYTKIVIDGYLKGYGIDFFEGLP